MAEADKRAALIADYKALADLTAPLCGKDCNLPHSCCSPEYCQMAIDLAARFWDMTLTPTTHPRLPMMGPAGCIAPPHVRPLCTRHLCSVNAFGVDPDPAVTETYFDIIGRIDGLEWEVLGG